MSDRDENQDQPEPPQEGERAKSPEHVCEMCGETFTSDDGVLVGSYSYDSHDRMCGSWDFFDGESTTYSTESGPGNAGVAVE